MLAVTLAPVLCSFFFTNKKEEPDTLLDRIMKRRYLRALELVSAGIAQLTLAGDGRAVGLSRSTLVPHLGGEFMPPLEEGNLWIRAILPRTVSLEKRAPDRASGCAR